MAASGAAAVHCAQLKEQANNCLVYLRILKTTVLNLHEKVHEPLQPGTSLEDLQHTFDKLSRRIDEYYLKIEHHALLLPDKVPPVDSLTRIAQVFQEDQTQKGRDTLDAMVDSVNWNEAYFQFMHYAEQFCKQGFRKKPSLFDNRSLTFSNWNSTNSPHLSFEQSFYAIQKEMHAKKMGIWATLLEKSAFGSVMEMKVGVLVDRQPVVQQKMLLIENNGIVELVIFVAPHEEWRYLDDYGEYGGRRLDLMQRSRYIVYQKLTVQANQSLNLLLSSIERPGNQYVAAIFQVFSRYHKLFETKCRYCGNVMKDFLPCVMYDPRAPNMSFHDSCR